MTAEPDSRQTTRSRLRAARRAIPPEAARDAATRVAERIEKLPAFHAARRIALYMPFDGELDTAPIAATAARRNKQLYLPALAPQGLPAALLFRELTEDKPLIINRFGIPEPGPAAATVPARTLDIIITPLVGFGSGGARLGMGAGFYDRTFSFLRHRKQWLKPRLIGVGYDRQRIDTLTAKSWDVPLWCIATEHALYKGVKR